MSIPLPDYALLEQRLRVAGAAIQAAEVHGVVCGLLCIAGRDAASSWLREQRETFAGPDDDVEAACTLLDDLEAASWSALSGAVLEFEPLLPDDDVALGNRTAALGQFCLGFVGGLALGGWSDTPESGGRHEVGEVVRDMSAISQAGMDDAEAADPESAEFSYVELAEYVRVGVQLVFETLTEAGASPPTIH